ncbi:MAG: four-carbon acid sugar kinase family protein [Desulfobacterales bacterium]
MEPRPIKKNDLLKSLQDEWPVDLLPQIQKQVKASERKVVVLDDDPTGTQTVHGIPVLTDWSVETLQAELSTDLPAFYILTNSRSFTLEVAQSINRGIGANLMEAARKTNRPFAVVSRSDSTLRGHFPGEVDALETALAQDFDGWIINPFFLEGGRYTIDDIHYVDEGGWLIPAAETEFARDSAFGYRSSHLGRWVEEKTGGRFSSDELISISINDLRKGGPERVASILAELQGGCVCVVNAASYRDLEVFTTGLLDAEAHGKHFLYRTAASFVRIRSGLSPRPLLTTHDLELPDSGNGLIIVGSYVPKTTDQVHKLLEHQEISHTEVSVDLLIDDKRRLMEIERVTADADRALDHGKDMVIFTSRQHVAGKDAKSSLSIGQKISQGLIAILDKISTKPRYILAKGGITASDVATMGLRIKRAMVCGQIIAGVPVWKLGAESRLPDSAYIVFPGNVGDSQALIEVVNKLRITK